MKGSGRLKISGCIIARNEEANIANCIKNLKGITDEIIVVDTGSEDDTIRIAKELGASVYEQKWENDFSKARNAALERAAGDWIIFLDADEYFNEASLPNVRPEIQKAHSNQNIEGMLCNVFNIDLDAGRFLDSSYVMRIFRNRKHIRYINQIHEEISNHGKKLKHSNNSDKISIIHTGYSSSLQAEKAKRNLEMLLNDTEHEIAAYHLATTYFVLHDFENAYRYADLALSVNAIREIDQLAYKMHFYKIIITMTLEGSNKAKIISLIREANQKFGEHPEIVKIEAIFLLMEKHYAKAYEKYLYALHCQEKYGRTLGQNNFEGTIDEVYNGIAQILCLMNKEADAFGYYVKALRSNKYNKEVFKSMLGLCMSMPEHETIAFLNSIYDVEKEEDVKFIIAQIADCGIPKLVLYYANKWNNTFAHEDDVLIYAFLAQHNYHNALEIALLYLKYDKDSYSPLVTSILIMGQLFSEAETIKDVIGADYFHLIMCFADDRNYSENNNTYASVFSKLIRHADQTVIADYLKSADAMDANLINRIAEIFLTTLHYEQAISYYQLLFKLQPDRERKAAAAFKTGYCFYKLKQYEESLDWFEKAIRNGYAENDRVEYLQWINNQSSDAAIKRKAEAIIV